MRVFLYLILLAICNTCAAQEYVYVNTDSLLLRSEPTQLYAVHAILSAPCRLQIEPYKEYKLNKAITNRFYHVSINMKNGKISRSTYYGWVEKKYTVRSKKLITFPGADTTINVRLRITPLYQYAGSDECDPNENNCREYLYPTYKGGEKQFPAPVKIVYHNGPRGGCYYIGARGQKKYVDAKLCK